MKRVTIALPVVCQQRILGWRLADGWVRGRHFKPSDGSHNVHFVSLRQLEEAIARAQSPEQLREGIIRATPAPKETHHG